MIGQTISHYKILAKIGEGGMGVVYKAQDTMLNRPVALKFLPQALTRDQETIDRFINEAQAASALDHTNICTIHEIGETEDGQMFIAMAYYAGETLQKKIASGKLQVAEVIDIATQAAQGLERAHEAGITHRDIKPSNLIITPRGEVKIIDFGLAKLTGQTRLTKTGSTLGTVAYMSPEQVRAESVDHRTDIWSLGVVLYEMLAGKLPFRGDYEAAMIYSIINEKPEPLAKHRTDVPDGLQQVLDKALVKDVEARYQHVDELLADLKGERKTGSTSTKPMSRIKSGKSKRALTKYASLAVVAVLTVLAGVWIFSRKPTTQLLPAHTQITFTGGASYPAISPDRQFLAYVSYTPEKGHKVLVQDLKGGQPLEVFSGIDRTPGLHWSPDGSELLFFAYLRDTSFSFGTFIVPRLGGGFRRINTGGVLCQSPDGSRIASTWPYLKQILLTTKATGDTSSISLSQPVGFIFDIDWSPLSGRLLMLTIHEQNEHYAIWTIKVDGTQQRKVVEDSVALFCPRWSANGEAIYYLRSSSLGSDVRSGGLTKNLLKVKISPATGEAKAPPQMLQSGLQAGEFFSLSTGNKQLFYTRDFRYSNLWLLTPDTKGKIVDTKQLTTGTSVITMPRISPDGERIAFSLAKGPHANIFVMPIEGGETQQITHLQSYNAGAAWSPDGKEIAFGSTQGGKSKVWLVSSSGGTPRPFQKSDLSSDMFNLTWSPGPHILYQRPGNRNYYFLNPKTEEQWPLVHNESYGWIFFPRYSPDDKQVAVLRNEELPPASSLEPVETSAIWLISLKDSSQFLLRKGSEAPIEWSADGKWIYAWNPYVKPVKVVMISAENGISKPFITLPFEDFFEDDYISISPDGKRLIVPAQVRQSDVWVMENFDPQVK